MPACTRRVVRGLFALALLCANAGAIACPLCMGAFQQSKAQELVSAPHAVLAVPTADPSRFRVIEIVKGERPASGTIEGGYPRNGPALQAAGSASGRPVLLIRDDLFPTWTVLGRIGADHAGWLRKLAEGKPAAQMSPEDWRARVALVMPYLEDAEPLAAELAYGEVAAAPYAALLAARPAISAPVVRRSEANPAKSAWQPVNLLLLGIAGDAHDARALEKRLEAAHAAGDAANLGSLIAADLQLRGPARLAWVEENYLVDRRRSSAEIEAALLALSVHGNASAAISRERVIASYRTFMNAHRDIAGYVARDLAAWQCWDVVPEYVALMKSGTPQQYPSKIAIVAYLRQSPNANAIDFSLPAMAGAR